MYVNADVICDALLLLLSFISNILCVKNNYNLSLIWKPAAHEIIFFPLPTLINEQRKFADPFFATFNYHYIILSHIQNRHHYAARVPRFFIMKVTIMRLAPSSKDWLLKANKITLLPKVKINYLDARQELISHVTAGQCNLTLSSTSIHPSMSPPSFYSEVMAWGEKIAICRNCSLCIAASVYSAQQHE